MMLTDRLVLAMTSTGRDGGEEDEATVVTMILRFFMVFSVSSVPIQKFLTRLFTMRPSEGIRQLLPGAG